MSEPLLFQRLINSWKDALSRSVFVTQFAITVIILLALGAAIPYFFEYIQNREGIRISDMVLDFIPSKDVSLLIFPIIYISLIITIFYLLFSPDSLLKALQAYTLLSLLRVVTIYFLNLEPPLEIVTLNDPVVSYFFYSEKVIDKDLFFSGHTATMTLLMLVVRNKYLKSSLLIATLLIAGLVLIQHVHYTIDVLAAPLFALASYYSVKKLL